MATAIYLFPQCEALTLVIMGMQQTKTRQPDCQTRYSSPSDNCCREDGKIPIEHTNVASSAVLVSLHQLVQYLLEHCLCYQFQYLYFVFVTATKFNTGSWI